MRSSICFLPLVASAALLSAQESAARVRIGPNVLVSRNTDVGHAELWIAAHPTQADKLVGMAATLRDVGSRVMLELYATADGGQTWTPSIPAHQLAEGGGDPLVGVSAQGTGSRGALGGG